MLQLLADRDPVRSGGQGDAEKVAQAPGQAYHFLPPPRLRLPDNRIQRIVQKMRIDLSLQRPQLRLGQMLLVPSGFLDQGLQPFRHLVDMHCQLLQFLHVQIGNPAPQIPFRNAAHRVFHG